MAEHRQARVLANLSDESRGALLALELEGHPDLVLKGGRYIIVHTGLENAEGKIVKRAYSLFAVKPGTQKFFLAAAPVAAGVASHYLGSLQEGDRLTFTGPWGRFHWPAEAREKKVVAAAFGSGITGILGYLASVPADCAVDLYWYKDEQGLLPAAMVRECLSEAHAMHERSLSDDPLRDLQNAGPEQRFVAAGEGHRIERCLNFLRAKGLIEDQLQSEIFYRSQDLSDAKADRG
ncbi:FAD-binding oxidoreductase [Oligoflexus tunisiensis]|uniref:FAD-binding oxidoreductase n=1 Tax=Oligoflexus tunisiensis TaxID=708132 RepID=UPI00114D02BF|nr:FAD-binding oxidoreductase [Oligoflexus tunisiensis]